LLCVNVTFIGNKICFILIFIFTFILFYFWLVFGFSAFLFFLLPTDGDINPMLSSRSSGCPFFLCRLFNFTYSKYFLCFRRFRLCSPTFLFALHIVFSLNSCFVFCFFFYAIFYMQIEFSSILIGFLIGYTCVYIRTTQLTSYIQSLSIYCAYLFGNVHIFIYIDQSDSINNFCFSFLFIFWVLVFC